MKVLHGLPNLSRAFRSRPPPSLLCLLLFLSFSPVEYSHVLIAACVRPKMPMHHFRLTPENEVIFQHLASAKSELRQCPSLA